MSNKRAEEEDMFELHRLLVQNAIALLSRGRLLVYKGEAVLVDGKPTYDLPTAAELTAAARILKDNGIDTPHMGAKDASAEAAALAGILTDLQELPELDNEYTSRH